MSQEPRDAAEFAARRTVAARLKIRQPDIIARYRRELEMIGSALVSNAEVWEECTSQAGHIITECAEALDNGGDAHGVDVPLQAIVDMAEQRGGRGIRPDSSVRAAMILFELVLAEASDVLGPDARHRLADLATTLSRSLFIRLEAGAKGYDAFLLDQIRIVNDADRRLLAREIHDRLGNALSLAMHQLEIVAAGETKGRRVIEEAVDVLSEAITELAAITTGLRTVEGGTSLRDALTAFVRSLRRTTPVVEIRVNGSQSWVSQEVMDEVFLILREALRNAFAHAEATRVAVEIDIAPHEVWARVVDNGIGFDTTAPRRDNGLASMSERAEALSGSVTLGSYPGSGTRVALWIPIPLSIDEA
ncbi:sensor histidine kinase [Nocardia sp. NPDC059240]|uniref:sensor histidine kinase n=1 Tax=Nocardia sp. NPDC059240 TaxID=3346786 RepID=UPI00368B8990